MSMDGPEGRHHRAEPIGPGLIEVHWTEASDHRTVLTLADARTIFGLGGTPDKLLAQRVTGLLTGCPDALRPLDATPHMVTVTMWRLVRVDDKPVQAG